MLKLKTSLKQVEEVVWELLKAYTPASRYDRLVTKLKEHKGVFKRQIDSLGFRINHRDLAQSSLLYHKENRDFTFIDFEDSGLDIKSQAYIFWGG